MSKSTDTSSDDEDPRPVFESLAEAYGEDEDVGKIARAVLQSLDKEEASS